MSGAGWNHDAALSALSGDLPRGLGSSLSAADVALVAAAELRLDAAERLAAAVAAALAVDVDPERLRVDVDYLEDADLASAIAVERLTRAPRLSVGSSFRVRDEAGRVLGVAYVEGAAL